MKVDTTEQKNGQQLRKNVLTSFVETQKKETSCKRDYGICGIW